MSKTLFEQPANVDAAPEANNPPEVKNDGDNQKTDEKRFTGADLENVVKDRLAREQKKFAKEREELQKRMTELEKGKVVPANQNVEEDLRQRLTKFESELKSKDERLGKYRQDNLRATIERSLVSHDCLDPEVVRDHLLSKGLVHLDDDDNVVVENATGDLDELVKSYLDQKPHLRRAPQGQGVGSRGPTKPASTGEMSTEQLEGLLGIPKHHGKTKLFGR